MGMIFQLVAPETVGVRALLTPHGDDFLSSSTSSHVRLCRSLTPHGDDFLHLARDGPVDVGLLTPHGDDFQSSCAAFRMACPAPDLLTPHGDDFPPQGETLFAYEVTS